MNAGAYREPVRIEKSSFTEDGIGNRLSVWSEYYKGYAYMNNLSGSEYWEADKLNHKIRSCLCCGIIHFLEP